MYIALALPSCSSPSRYRCHPLPSHTRSILARRSCFIHSAIQLTSLLCSYPSQQAKMRSFLLLALVGMLPAASLAQRGGGGRGGGGNFFSHGGGNAPNTLVTVASAAPAAATPAAAAPPAVAAPPATSAASGGGGSGAVSAALIPPYGITPGVKANDGTANCVGDNGKAIPYDESSVLKRQTTDLGQMYLPTTCCQVGHCCSGTSCTWSLVPYRSVPCAIGLRCSPLTCSTGTSQADQLARLNTCIVALQNVVGGPGTGVGCPIVSTTWTELRASL